MFEKKNRFHWEAPLPLAEKKIRLYARGGVKSLIWIIYSYQWENFKITGSEV